MYVELYGDNTKEQNGMPSQVYLKLRHLSGSYFRDGTGQVKEFRQPLGSRRLFEFNRFVITDTDRCNEDQGNGISEWLSCLLPVFRRRSGNNK